MIICVRACVRACVREEFKESVFEGSGVIVFSLPFITIIAVRHSCSCKPRLIHLHTLQEIGGRRRGRGMVKKRGGRGHEEERRGHEEERRGRDGRR